MTIRLGDLAPDFLAQTTEGQIKFHEWMEDGWAILFSHPKDFTPVCTTELGEAARLKDKFASRHVKLIGLSVDDLKNHEEWLDDIKQSQGHEVNYPIIADADKTIATMYGMIHPEMDDTFTVRTVFVVGPDKRVKLMLTYPMATGRNFEEILRVVDSLQLTADYQVATPANWTQGDEVIIVPSVTDEEARKAFPDGWRSELSYLRMVPEPKHKPH